MVQWWPFGNNKDVPSNLVGSPANALESATMKAVKEGTENTFGTDSGLAISPIDRMRDEKRALRAGDTRVTVMDPESIDCLISRYGSELQSAERKMQERVAQKSWMKGYDYDNDRLYNYWKEDQRAMKERLEIHWIDDTLDSYLPCLVYLLRICTTVGFVYGAGRTAYLYRTMDKTYAKLNGVSLSTIAFTEIPLSIVKGSAVAVAGYVGVSFGETSSRVVKVAMSDDVSAPERTWTDVVAAMTGCGVCGGAAFAFMHRKTLSPWGMRAVVAGFTGVATIAGLYLGYSVYRPFAAQRKHRLYEPHWRPWETRGITPAGNTTMRGRYI